MDINTPKKANKFMMFFTLYTVIAAVILSAVISLFEIRLNTAHSQIIFYTCVFMLPILIFWINSKKPFKELFPVKALAPADVFLIIMLSIATMPVMMVISAISTVFTSNVVSPVITDLLTESDMFVNVIAIAVLPAVFEEFIFRGMILRGYKNINLILAALINGLFFGIMHLNIQQFFYAAFLGFVFSILVHYTKSIFSSIIAHFTINGTQLALFALISGMADKLPPEAVEAAETVGFTSDTLIAYVVTMAIFLAVSVVLLKSIIKRHKETSAPIIMEKYGVYDDYTAYQTDEANLIAEGYINDYFENTGHTGLDIMPEENYDPEKYESGNKIFNWPFFVTIFIFALSLIPLFIDLSAYL